MDRILFSFGPITIYWYSVTMLLSVLTGIYLSTKESKKQGMYSFISDLVTYIIIFGIIGARLYYVIFNFDNYKYDILSIFKIWEGGIAIYGAIIGGLLAIVYLAKKREQSIIKTTDIIVPGLILAQSIGRWGNFFNGEAHGPATTLEFLSRLHLPAFVINGMNIGGAYYQPTFLYESLWCLIGFIIILFIRRIKYIKVGQITGLYLVWYGLGRFLIEGLRTDSLMFMGLKQAQVVSVLMAIIGIVIIIVKKGTSKLENQYNSRGDIREIRF